MINGTSDRGFRVLGIIPARVGSKGARVLGTGWCPVEAKEREPARFYLADGSSSTALRKV
jgi:hypothetical protein